MTATSNIWGTTSVSTHAIQFRNTFAAEAYLRHNDTPVAPPPIKHLKQDHSPNCCGCDFMSWFPKPDIFGKIEQKVLDSVEAQLKEHKARYNSMMLVILNNLQRPFYEKMLFNHGYKVIMDHVYHPGHGHDLILYGWQKYAVSPNATR
jgi:hypothetical protein